MFFYTNHIYICLFVLIVQSPSCVQLFGTPWTAAHQAPLSSTISQSMLKFMSIESQCMLLLLPLLSHFSSVRLCATPETAAHEAPSSLGFSRQEHWSGLPFPSPRGLPRPGVGPVSPALAGRFFTTEPPGKDIFYMGHTVCLTSQAINSPRTGMISPPILAECYGFSSHSSLLQ